MKVRNLLLISYLALILYMYMPELEKAQLLSKLSNGLKGVAYRTGKAAIRLETASHEVLS